MERRQSPSSVELVLEGEWAPLKAIDKDCGETTMIKDFPAISNPDRMITVTHDVDMKLEDCNVYTFTRLDPAENSFFVVVVDQQSNVGRASILRVDPETEGDAGAFSDSIEFQAQMGLTLPSRAELEELNEIVTAFVESQVAELTADIENR